MFAVSLLVRRVKRVVERVMPSKLEGQKRSCLLRAVQNTYLFATGKNAIGIDLYTFELVTCWHLLIDTPHFCYSMLSHGRQRLLVCYTAFKASVLSRMFAPTLTSAVYCTTCHVYNDSLVITLTSTAFCIRTEVPGPFCNVAHIP